MPKLLAKLLENNKEWSENIRKDNPDYFTNLASVQNPRYLWIGCSDSRVPANQIIGLKPGEVFVHRNIANIVPHTDVNCLSVIQYAVEMLKVKHIIVTGHYGCGGIKVAMDNSDHGQINNWLCHIKDIYHANFEEIQKLATENEKADRLCELNVINQVYNVAKTSILQRAWKKGQEIMIHGWVYSLNNGIITDLKTTISDNNYLHKAYKLS